MNNVVMEVGVANIVYVFIWFADTSLYHHRFENYYQLKSLVSLIHFLSAILEYLIIWKGIHNSLQYMQ